MINPFKTKGFFVAKFFDDYLSVLINRSLMLVCQKWTANWKVWAPTIKNTNMKVDANPNIYKQAQRFADITKKLIQLGHIKLAKRCLLEAENIFLHGTTEVKNVISNIYVFSVSGFMELHRCSIKELLPPSLQTEYYKQVNTSGV